MLLRLWGESWGREEKVDRVSPKEPQHFQGGQGAFTEKRGRLAGEVEGGDPGSTWVEKAEQSKEWRCLSGCPCGSHDGTPIESLFGGGDRPERAEEWLGGEEGDGQFWL